MADRIVTEPTTARHRIGQCPGCGSGIYAEVQVVTEVHPPRLDAQGGPVHCAHARVVASSIEHTCQRHIDGEWETTA